MKPIFTKLIKESPLLARSIGEYIKDINLKDDNLFFIIDNLPDNFSKEEAIELFTLAYELRKADENSEEKKETINNLVNVDITKNQKTYNPNQLVRSSEIAKSIFADSNILGRFSLEMINKLYDYYLSALLRDYYLSALPKSKYKEELYRKHQNDLCDSYYEKALDNRFENIINNNITVSDEELWRIVRKRCYANKGFDYKLAAKAKKDNPLAYKYILMYLNADWDREITHALEFKSPEKLETLLDATHAQRGKLRWLASTNSLIDEFFKKAFSSIDNENDNEIEEKQLKIIEILVKMNWHESLRKQVNNWIGEMLQSRYYNDSSGRRSEILLKFGADPNAYYTSSGWDYDYNRPLFKTTSAFQEAIKKDYQVAIDLYLKYGHIPKGENTLKNIVLSKSSTTLDKLIEKGFKKAGQVDAYGIEALERKVFYNAIKNENTEMLTKLLNYDSNLASARSNLWGTTELSKQAKINPEFAAKMIDLGYKPTRTWLEFFGLDKQIKDKEQIAESLGIKGAYNEIKAKDQALVDQMKNNLSHLKIEKANPISQQNIPLVKTKDVSSVRKV